METTTYPIPFTHRLYGQLRAILAGKPLPKPAPEPPQPATWTRVCRAESVRAALQEAALRQLQFEAEYQELLPILDPARLRQEQIAHVHAARGSEALAEALDSVATMDPGKLAAARHAARRTVERLGLEVFSAIDMVVDVAVAELDRLAVVAAEDEAAFARRWGLPLTPGRGPASNVIASLKVRASEIKQRGPLPCSGPSETRSRLVMFRPEGE